MFLGLPKPKHCNRKVLERLLKELETCLLHLDDAGLDVPAIQVDYARAYVEDLLRESNRPAESFT